MGNTSGDAIRVLVAKQIVTVHAGCPTATAVAVKGDRIVAVGTLDQVTAALADAPFTVDETHIDDVLLPGLIDQHLHPVLGASTLATEVIATEDWVLPDRTYPAAHSHDEYVHLLAEAEARTPHGEWLFSWGYHKLWHGELSRAVLDSISTERPIGVWQRSCHEFYLNSAALDALGIDEATLTTDAETLAMIDLDRGHFWERGFMVFLFGLLMPELFSQERFTRGLHQMVRYLHQNGVTAVNEPGAVLVPGAWELYQAILGHEDTPFTTTFVTDGRGPADRSMPHDQTLARAQREYDMAPSGKLRFFPKQVKLFADGAILSQLMQMKDPYLDANGDPNPDHHGEWLLTPPVLEERTKLYWDAGFQIHVHVNGDLGLDVVLDTFERRMREHPRPDHRTVIVHFANSTEEQVDRIARLGAIVSANPYYTTGFADKYGEVGLGPDRADQMVRSGSVVDRSIPLSFHSDLPMGRSDPIGMMDCAVNRRTQSGRIAAPEQRISVEAALRAVTIDAAQSWRQEHELGSIEAGKCANFTVVDRDPLAINPEELDSIQVLGTVYGGRWFPVPDGSAGRGSGTALAARQLAGHEAADDHRGCICGVAHLIAQGLELNGVAA
jgi:predicted amidohydrolase YtcJ